MEPSGDQWLLVVRPGSSNSTSTTKRSFYRRHGARNRRSGTGIGNRNLGYHKNKEAASRGIVRNNNNDHNASVILHSVYQPHQCMEDSLPAAHTSSHQAQDSLSTQAPLLLPPPFFTALIPKSVSDRPGFLPISTTRNLTKSCSVQ